MQKWVGIYVLVVEGNYDVTSLFKVVDGSTLSLNLLNLVGIWAGRESCCDATRRLDLHH